MHTWLRDMLYVTIKKAQQLSLEAPDLLILLSETVNITHLTKPIVATAKKRFRRNYHIFKYFFPTDT